MEYNDAESERQGEEKEQGARNKAKGKRQKAKGKRLERKTHLRQSLIKVARPGGASGLKSKPWILILQPRALNLFSLLKSSVAR